MECNFDNYTVRWQMSKFANVSHTFLRYLLQCQRYKTKLPSKRHTIFKLLPPKNISRSRSAIFAITPFDGICQNLQMFPTHFYAISYRFRDIDIFNFSSAKIY